RLAIGKIELRWFPQPNVVVNNAQLAFDDGNRVSIGSVRIYPSMMHLFTGRFVVRRALLQKPKLTIQLPESSTLPTDLEMLKSQIRSALLNFTGERPASSIELVNGSAEIRGTGKSPVIVDELTAEVAASAAALSFDLSGRSSLCERLKIEGRIVPENLA